MLRPSPLIGEGAGQSATGYVTDLAGNYAEVTESNINIDKTVPVVTEVTRTAVNANGWNNTDVTVEFTATDGLSGVETTLPVYDTVTTEGINQEATGIVYDLAGNEGLL